MTGPILLPAPDQCRFAVMGAGWHLCTLAEKLVEAGFPRPLVFTYPRVEHERDRILLTDPRLYKNVFDTCDHLGIPVVDEKLDDAAMVARMLEAGCSAVFSLSWRRRITRTLIDAFPERIFNLHPSLLPKERGSGTFSYRILNGSREVSATLHLVDEGLDTGPVILQQADEIAVNRPKPRDFLIATNDLYGRLMDRFLGTVLDGRPLQPRPQVEDDNTYLPLLHTETNGAIDWDWSADEIERFIRAFGPPYPGAYTYVGETRFAVTEASLEPSPIAYHPYLAGRVVSLKTDGTAQVIARGGLLRLEEIAVEGERMAPARLLKHTSCLLTPRAVLDRARTAVLRAAQMNVPDIKGRQ